MEKIKASPEVKEFLRKIASKGGKKASEVNRKKKGFYANFSKIGVEARRKKKLSTDTALQDGSRRGTV